MAVDLGGAAYAASRISSTLKGSTKQFGWLQAPATKSKMFLNCDAFGKNAVDLFHSSTTFICCSFIRPP
jgi:hypothetical protein